MNQLTDSILIQDKMAGQAFSALNTWLILIESITLSLILTNYYWHAYSTEFNHNLLKTILECQVSYFGSV